LEVRHEKTKVNWGKKREGKMKVVAPRKNARKKRKKSDLSEGNLAHGENQNFSPNLA